MKKLLFTITCFVSVVVFGQVMAQACSCELPQANSTLKRQVRTAYKSSLAVFVGRVIDVVSLSETHSVIVKMRVDRSWKGNLQNEVTLATGQGGGDCGYKFEVGQSYLVYAYGPDVTRLSTNICQRTAALTDAAADIKLLGNGKLL